MSNPINNKEMTSKLTHHPTWVRDTSARVRLEAFCRTFRNSTLDPNCLNACDTPAYIGGLPSGTFSYYAVTAAFPTGLAVGTRLLVVTP